MGINFPNTPTVGQQWPSPPVAGLPVYQWDGEKWTAGPPAIPDGLVHYDIAQTLTDAQKLQARSNIGLAQPTRIISSGSGNIDITDHGKLLYITNAGLTTLTLGLASALGDGFWCDIYVGGSGPALPNPALTINRSGSDQIDLGNSVNAYQFEGFRLQCTQGAAFFTFNHRGEWKGYTATYSSSGGGGAVGLQTCRFKKVRTTVFLNIEFQINTAGANYSRMSLPVPPATSTFNYYNLAGWNGQSGDALYGFIPQGGTWVECRTYANGVTAAANTFPHLTGLYECSP